MRYDGRRFLCHTTLYWAQFLEMDIHTYVRTINLSLVFKYFSVDKQLCNEKSMPKQMMRLKDHRIWDDESIPATL